MTRKPRIHMGTRDGRNSFCNCTGWINPHRLTDDWDKVTCQRCLIKARGKGLLTTPEPEPETKGPITLKCPWTGVSISVTLNAVAPESTYRLWKYRPLAGIDLDVVKLSVINFDQMCYQLDEAQINKQVAPAAFFRWLAATILNLNPRLREQVADLWQKVKPSEEIPERFRIVWTGTQYKVNIPRYEGGEVVRAEVYDQLQRKYRAFRVACRMLRRALKTEKGSS